MFPYIETSQLICGANQLSGFYMMGTLVVKGLIKSEHLDYQKDPEKKERWFKIIPRNNIPHCCMQTTLVRKFWILIYYGKKKAKFSPSLFDCVKPIMIPIKTLAKWKSTKTLSDDKTGLFSQQDNISDFKYLGEVLRQQNLYFWPLQWLYLTQPNYFVK